MVSCVLWITVILLVECSRAAHAHRKKFRKIFNSTSSFVEKQYPDDDGLVQEVDSKPSQLRLPSILTDYQNTTSSLALSRTEPTVEGNILPSGNQSTVPLTQILYDGQNRSVGWKINVANQNKPVLLTILVGIKSDSFQRDGNTSTESVGNLGIAPMMKNIENNSTPPQELILNSPPQVLASDNIVSIKSNDRKVNLKQILKLNPLLSQDENNDNVEKEAEGITCHCIEEEDMTPAEELPLNVDENQDQQVLAKNNHLVVNSLNLETPDSEGYLEIPTRSTLDFITQHILTAEQPYAGLGAEELIKKQLLSGKRKAWDSDLTTPASSTYCFPKERTRKDCITENILSSCPSIERGIDPDLLSKYGESDLTLNRKKADRYIADSVARRKLNPSGLQSHRDIVLDDELIKNLLKEKVFDKIDNHWTEKVDLH